MSDAAKFFALGLGSGAIYALVALGIVLVYRASGIINFSHGAIALTGAGTFYETRDSLSTPGALVVGVVVAALTSAGINLVVMAPMRRASPLTRLVATLGLLTLGTELWKRRFDYETVSQFLPNDPIEPFGHGVLLGEDRLWILALTVMVSGVLALVYRRTRFGLATEAVAQDVTAAEAQGWSPHLVATLNWAVAGGLAGLGGILLSTLIGLSASSQTLVVVPALAAALIGGFSSFTLTVAGGLLVGVLESEALHYANPTGVTKGLSTAVPFFVVLAVLMLRGRALPLRSFRADRLPSLGSGRINRRGAVAVALVLIASVHSFSDTWANAVITSAIAALVGLSLVVVTGYAGQLSLAQWSMAGMGALFAGRVAGDAWGMPFPLALSFGVLVTVPVGVVIALPALRIRGASLAVVTLTLGFVLAGMVLSNDIYTGGAIRGTVIPEPTILGWSVDSIRHPARYGTVAIGVVCAAAAVVRKLRTGRSGRRLIAVRDNERAAASLGVSVVGAKLYAFAMSSLLASAGGALIAFRNPRLSFEQFNLFGNIDAVLFACFAGIGWIAGGIVAGGIAASGMTEHLIEHLVATENWYAAVAAALLVVTLVLQPDGSVPSLVARWASLLRRGDRDPVPVPVVGVSRIERVPPRSLELEQVTARFGSVLALDRIDLSVGPGEVVGLIGANGAGKSTLIDVASGFIRCEGSVRLGGRDLTRASAADRAAAGLTRSFQSLELFEDLTVLDNLRVACDDGRRGAYLVDLVRSVPQPLSPAATAAVEEFQLEGLLGRRPTELSYAERRTVAVARAVATSPSVLLLDEPAAGLDEPSIEELSRLITRLAHQWGMAVLLVEHDVAMVMRTCDRIVAIDFGRVIAAGTPATIREDPAVISAYLGASEPETSSTGGRHEVLGSV